MKRKIYDNLLKWKQEKQVEMSDLVSNENLPPS